jgi:peptide/nickel transport system permease protein
MAATAPEVNEAEIVNGESLPKPTSALVRVGRYTLGRLLVLGLMVGVSIYVSIIIINYGGYIDAIYRAQIDEGLNFLSLSLPRDTTPEELTRLTEELRQTMYHAAGLDQPFLLRCLRWWWNGIRLDFGEALRSQTMAGDSRLVKDIVLERIPPTLLLFGTGNLLIFITSISVALGLARKYGSLLDRVMITLSPLSAAPSWIYGILLIIIFAMNLNLLPYSGMFDETPPAHPVGYVWILAKHMLLPVAAIFISTFFQGVYTWRTYFLIHAGDDYVEMARAKGLPAPIVERQYILRPALPFIITNFTLLLISLWQGSLTLEQVFAWPGMGTLILEAIRYNDRPIVVSQLVIYAYLLALSVFLLDFIYALVDPRVRLGGGDPSQQKRLRQARRRERLQLRPAQVGRAVLERATTIRLPRLSIKLSRPNPKAWLQGLWSGLPDLRPAWRELARYPSAIGGLVIILALVGVSGYAVLTIPYDQVIEQWRNLSAWSRMPKNARPTWVNWFRVNDLPSSLYLSTKDGAIPKTITQVSEGMWEVKVDFPIDFPYQEPPQEVAVFVESVYQAKRPHFNFSWLTPDGRTVDLGSTSPQAASFGYFFGQEERLKNKLKQPVMQAMFAAPAGEPRGVLDGRYTLRVTAYLFEAGSAVDIDLVIYGEVYGWAGTDFRRRDLSLSMLWGAPVALAFGLAGALATSMMTMIVAAIGAWFGGWVDDVVQRLTEIDMMIPALPLALTTYYLYGKSIWVLLGVMVLLSIFGSSVKNFRAIYLQIKEAPYIEAALAYGASSWRIVLRYMVPRIMPVLIPQLVTLIPGYVFLEATLAYLGVSDIYLPTWGKTIYEALTNGAYQGQYYWVLEPMTLLLVTGLAFAMVGFALDRIFNPRLREG